MTDQEIKIDDRWPKIHEPWTLEEVVDFCKAKGQLELADYVLGEPPDIPFKTDGCSLWFDCWFGLDLYPHCLVHDIWYWAGRLGDRATRKMADEQLAKAVSGRRRPIGGLLMWIGVRIGGGSWLRNRSFSWGFGRSSLVKGNRV